jgi:arylsulfatase A-like enzyme
LPAPRDAGAAGDLEPWRPPSFNEPDVLDKPAWLSDQPALDAAEIAELDGLRRRQIETLRAMDDAVERIVATLKATGELGDTILLYVSDNGYLLGEHRLVGKAAPFEESIRVPFLLRYDALGEEASRISDPVLNIDVAPTIAELAAVEIADTDGRSLVPLLTDAGGWSREAFLVEHLGPRGPSRGGSGIPTYCAVHTGRYLYVVYQRGVNDLYDLRMDPAQLDNLAPQTHGRLERRLRTLLRSLCDPPPPGFDRLA